MKNFFKTFTMLVNNQHGFLPLLSAVAPLVSSAVNYFSTKDTNKENARQAELNRQFQANQSATAYQTATKDMKAAGLNPMLAYSQGGAQAMSGSTAQMQTPTISDLSSGFSSAAQQLNAKKQLEQTDLINASAIQTQSTQAMTNIASAKVSDEMAKKIEQDRLNSIADLALRTNDQTLKREAQAQTLKNQKEEQRLTNLRSQTEAAKLPGIQAESNWEAAQSNYKTKHADVIVPLSVATQQVGQVLDGVSSAFNVFDKFMPSKTVHETHHDYDKNGRKTMSTTGTYKKR